MAKKWGGSKKRGGKGRHENFSAIPLVRFQEKIKEILKDYGEEVYQTTENALDAAADVLINELKSVSKPRKTGKFARQWKSTGRGEYKLTRFIGNSYTVKGKDGEKISLANILEYSTIRGEPFIRETFAESTVKMAAAFEAELQKEE